MLKIYNPLRGPGAVRAVNETAQLYRREGTTCTFWLLIDSEGWTVKGEGFSDVEAFEEIYGKLPEIEQRAVHLLIKAAAPDSTGPQEKK